MIRTSIILAAICCAALWWATGDSLELWLGGFGVVALLVPIVAVERVALQRRFSAVGLSCLFVLACWIVATIRTDVRLMQFLWCAILLVTFTVACFSLVMLLEASSLPPSVCSLLVTVTAVAWLTAPVWMSQWMNESRAAFLSEYQPLLAANGQLKPLGIWLEQPRIYRHVVMGQDVPYSLAATVWKSAALHATVSAMGLFAWRLARRSETGREAHVAHG